MPTHHLPHDLLTAYAAGTADEAEALFAATHLALCPACRAVSEGLEAVGGAVLDRQESAPMADDALAKVLARLDEPAPVSPPGPPAGPNDAPLPLRAIAGSLDALPYRRVAPGILRFDLPWSTPKRPVAIVSLRPGLTVPAHRHAASERGLVLRGGFTDETGHYLRGDVSWRSPDDEEPHRQHIDRGERCVVLMVDDGPKVPVDWRGRVVNALFGL